MFDTLELQELKRWKVNWINVDIIEVRDDPKLLGDSGEVSIFEWSDCRLNSRCEIFSLLDGKANMLKFMSDCPTLVIRLFIWQKCITKCIVGCTIKIVNHDGYERSRTQHQTLANCILECQCEGMFAWKTLGHDSWKSCSSHWLRVSWALALSLCEAGLDYNP
jgi:hypothetical protein